MKKLLLLLLFLIPNLVMGKQIFSCTTDNEEIFKKKFFFETDKFKETSEERKDFNTVKQVSFQIISNDEAVIKVYGYLHTEILCKKSGRISMGYKDSYACVSGISHTLPPKEHSSTRGLKYLKSAVHFWPKDKFLLIELDEQFRQVNNSFRFKSVRVKNDYDTRYIYRAKCE